MLILGTCTYIYFALLNLKNTTMTKSLFTLMAAGILALGACTTGTDADSATTAEAAEAAETTGAIFQVDTTSTVNFIGTKPNGEHHGTMQVSTGSLSVENGELKGGSFTMDVTSTVIHDLQGKDKSDLEGHLKSPDFFHIEKWPTSSFTITEVKPYDSTVIKSKLSNPTHIISGNLTLRDSTLNVTFPASVRVNDNNATAQADFNIDRTRWGMNYKGPNNPADFFISKEVNIKIDLKAVKADTSAP